MMSTNFGFPDIPLGRYVHKDGGKYTVLGLMRNSTNKDDGRPMVSYVSWSKGTPCCRDYEEFVELVEWPDGVTRPRFCPVDPSTGEPKWPFIP